MLVLLLPVLMQGQPWQKVELPTEQYLRSVYFTDSLFGWIAGDSGTILHTTDGGENWSIQNSGTENRISDIFFLNRDLGWATAINYTAQPYGTIVLSTTDGGENWSQQAYPDHDLFMNCILFLDSLNGWMGGSPHALVKTSDGGITWQQASIDTSTLAFFPVLEINFLNENVGYATGGIFDIAGVIWHTNNGGQNWTAIDPQYAPADEVHGMHIFDSLHALGAGGDPDFAYGMATIETTDGAQSWTYEEPGIQGNAYDIDFRNDYEAWCPLGPQRKLIVSLDAGQSWTPVPAPDSVEIFDICFPDSLHGYGVGRNGAFIRFDASFPVGVQENDIQQNVAGRLKVYPNPIQSNTNLEFELNGSGRCQIMIYEQSGKRKAMMDYQGQKGRNELSLDTGELPAGIYFFVLKQHGNKQVRKLIKH
ncbi:MAG: YCF48-related protein [Bacteroidota bacterium]|nr:YCF48-related protein [Bacteroidota bacterium]